MSDSDDLTDYPQQRVRPAAGAPAVQTTGARSAFDMVPAPAVAACGHHKAGPTTLLLRAIKDLGRPVKPDRLRELLIGSGMDKKVYANTLYNAKKFRRITIGDAHSITQEGLDYLEKVGVGEEAASQVGGAQAKAQNRTPAGVQAAPVQTSDLRLGYWSDGSFVIQRGATELTLSAQDFGRLCAFAQLMTQGRCNHVQG
jgi:hypothetical protein